MPMTTPTENAPGLRAELAVDPVADEGEPGRRAGQLEADAGVADPAGKADQDMIRPAAEYSVPCEKFTRC